MLKVEGNFNVTGPLETFANAGGVHLARALLAEFAENVREAGGRAHGGSGSPATDSPRRGEEPASGPARRAAIAPAAELRGGTLLWRAFLGWLKQLLPEKRTTG